MLKYKKLSEKLNVVNQELKKDINEKTTTIQSLNTKIVRLNSTINELNEKLKRDISSGRSSLDQGKVKLGDIAHGDIGKLIKPKK